MKKDVKTGISTHFLTLVVRERRWYLIAKCVILVQRQKLNGKIRILANTGKLKSSLRPWRTTSCRPQILWKSQIPAKIFTKYLFSDFASEPRRQNTTKPADLSLLAVLARVSCLKFLAENINIPQQMIWLHHFKNRYLLMFDFHRIN